MVVREIGLEEIGKKIRHLRIKAGFTSHENFAFEYGLSTSYYGKVEQGKANVGMLYFLNILRIHEISVIDFFNSISDFGLHS